MLVKELIERLKKQNRNDLVVLCIDAKHEVYSPIFGIHSDYVYKDATVEDVIGHGKNDFPKGQKCITIC